MFYDKIKNFWINREKKLRSMGRISIIDPYKIERESILISLIIAKSYAKGVLLDMGCGNKPYESVFSDVIDKHIGIDLPYSKSATKVKKRADVHGSILNLPFKSNTFDTILSTQVLEHTPEPKVMLKEAYRTLEGGGF